MQRAIALEPPHVSAYGLIVEEGTPLARMVSANLVRPAPVEAEAELYELTMDLLDRVGYEHYEVSSYARPGYRCKHNLAYWSRAPYLGLALPPIRSGPAGRRGECMVVDGGISGIWIGTSA